MLSPMVNSKMDLLAQEISRRAFIRVSALAGGGLLVACGGGRPGPGSGVPRAVSGNVVDPPEDPVPSADNFQPHAYLKIAANNVITIFIGPAEIGQGIITSVAQIIADELDADWALVGWEQAPVDTRYRNPIAGQMMLTAASFSLRGMWLLLRYAGREIRDLLVQAAADDWGVDAATLRSADSFVIDDANSRRISYGALAEQIAAAQAADVQSYDPTAKDAEIRSEPENNPKLKSAAEFSLIGQSMKRLDGPEKANGTAVYGMDLYAEDLGLSELLVAVVKRPARFGETIAVTDDTAAKAVPGVIDVLTIAAGVVVVAEDYWSAVNGRDKLLTESSGPGESLSSRDLPDSYAARNTSPGAPIHSEGNPAFAGVLTSDYFFPFLGHGMMEPLNTVVNYTGAAAEIWVGSQWPDLHEIYAANVLGLTTEQITFNKLLAGGGFGRRANLYGDTIIEACQVARALVPPRPVKVIWSREDDIKGGYYRPASACRLEANLEGGRIRDWGFRVTSTPIYPTAVVEAVFRGAGADNEFTGLEPEVQTTQGAVELPYDIPNQRVGQNEAPPNQVPLLWVRSVANATNIYAVENFFDRVAKAAGQDPLEFRKAHLQTAANSRHLKVVSAVGDALGWSGRAQKNGNTAFGMAVFGSYASVLCTGMQVTVSEPDSKGIRSVKIDRVVSAVDVGTVINPDLLRAQIESGIVFGLSTAMHSQITFDNGFVQQSNFDDFRVMRMFECPPIETLLLPSGDAPGGAGELGVPCAAPALANAIAAVTGEDYDALPLAQYDLVFSR